MLAASALGSIDTPPPEPARWLGAAQSRQTVGHAATGSSAWQGPGGNGGPQPARPTVVPGFAARNRAGSGPSHPLRVAAAPTPKRQVGVPGQTVADRVPVRTPTTRTSPGACPP